MATTTQSRRVLLFVAAAAAAIVRTATADGGGVDGCAKRFDVHDDKIIRTEDSKKLGAKFVDSLQRRDRLGCLELCCQTARCDVFVFEEKVNGRKGGDLARREGVGGGFF